MNPIAGYGHSLLMGFTVGGMGRVWYFEFNSEQMKNGPVTLHYVVIDRAGNGKYYEDPLVIMNQAPLISGIRLGTDIRGADWTGLFSIGDTNASYNTATGQNGSMAVISGQPGVWSSTNTQIDYTKEGISNFISSTSLTPDRLIDFNVRNNLLALRVETAQEPEEDKTRSFRLEYVSGAKRVTDIKEVRKGQVYVVGSEPSFTTAKLGGLGAPGEGPWPRGSAFLAAVDGKRDNGTPEGEPVISGEVVLWELNNHVTYDTDGERDAGIPSALELDDAVYPEYEEGVNSAQNAEFVYTSGAFGGGSPPVYGDHIIDFTFGAEYPPVGGWPTNDDQGPPRAHSLFILRVFDGPEKDLFGTFVLIRIRVNNNDNTPPFAQLYDINPYTEGQVRQQTQQRSLAPMSIGANRTRGGVWNTNTGFNWNVITKSGHVEPRAITGLPSPYSTYKHTLTPAQMGGSAYANIWDNSGGTVNPNAFYEVDTVSGRVILRGYAEEDQRIQQVDLVFTTSGGTSKTVTILEQANDAANGGNPGTYVPATTGFLKVPLEENGKVYFHDTADVRRHRVEWAYAWETETTPPNFIVGSVNVRAVAYNMNDAPVDLASAGKVSGILEAGETTGETAQEQHTSDSVTNPGFPTGLYKYNTINFNVRPYMTGIRRDLSKSYHNNRSLQGRVALSRGETIAVTGFNLGGGGTTTTLSLPGAASLPTSAVNGSQQSNYQLESAEAYRSRILSSAIPVGATTTVAGNNANGAVRLIVASSGDSFYAVNTRVPNNANGERPLLNTGGDAVDSGGSHWIQPWNTESSAGIEGSDLWDDFTSVHIWSDGVVPANNSRDNGYFRSQGDNWVILNPSMSINPRNGVLHASHTEGGGGSLNNGKLKRSTNAGNADAVTLRRFYDPIIHSDIYFSPGATSANADVWTTSSVIGRAASWQAWVDLGGIWVSGPGGATMGHNGGEGPNSYYVESTFYNASINSPGAVATPPSTDQFLNSHVVTSIENGQEYIHVSYYDSKDGSIKYKWNQRGSPGTVNGTGAARTWVNLDGSFDEDDFEVTTATAQNFTISQLLDGDIPSSATASQDYWLTRQNGLFIIPSGTGALHYSTETAYRVGNGTTTDPGSSYRYIYSKDVADGDHVKQGDLVYTLSDSAGTSGVTYPIYALSTGTIYGVDAKAIGASHWNTGAGSSTNYTYYIVPDAALNYVREVYVTNNIRVKKGDPVLLVGENPSVVNTNLDTFLFYAAADGTITNLALVGTQVANTVNGVGVAGANTNGVSTIITGTNGATGERLYTINPRLATNYIHQIGPNLALNSIVTAGEMLWVLGVRNSAILNGTTYTIEAPISGRITAIGGDTSVTTAVTNLTTPTVDTNGNYSNSITINNNSLIRITPINDVDSTRVVLGRTTPPAGDVPAPYSYDRYMEKDWGPNSSDPPNGTNATMMPVGSKIDAGEHNAIAIALNSQNQGCPVIAYYDNTNQRLKMAVSRRPNPISKNDWVIRDFVIPPNNPLSYQTGQFVSMRIDNGARDSSKKNIVHIAAFNSQRSCLVYITGKINPPAISGNSGNLQQDHLTATDNVFTGVVSGELAPTVQVVDSVGIVGRWSTISLDEDGDPWIAYMDEMNRGSMDGAKVAYYKASLYKKAQNDMYGTSVTGWETMHVPALYRVENQIIDGRENGRLGFENFPTRNFQATTDTRFWSGALGYVGTGAGPGTSTAVRTRYRIAYYVK
jgi:hypothetical protein